MSEFTRHPAEDATVHEPIGAGELAAGLAAAADPDPADWQARSWFDDYADFDDDGLLVEAKPRDHRGTFYGVLAVVGTVALVLIAIAIVSAAYTGMWIWQDRAVLR